MVPRALPTAGRKRSGAAKTCFWPLWHPSDDATKDNDDYRVRTCTGTKKKKMSAAGLSFDRPPEVSFDFWLDGPNRVEELGSEISDILIIRSDI